MMGNLPSSQRGFASPDQRISMSPLPFSLLIWNMLETPGDSLLTRINVLSQMIGTHRESFGICLRAGTANIPENRRLLDSALTCFRWARELERSGYHQRH